MLTIQLIFKDKVCRKACIQCVAEYERILLPRSDWKILDEHYIIDEEAQEYIDFLELDHQNNIVIPESNQGRKKPMPNVVERIEKIRKQFFPKKNHTEFEQ